MTYAVNCPASEWTVAKEADDLGWSKAALANAYKFASAIGSSAIMIVQDGVVVSAWGRVADVTGIASMRKSILSALIGIHEAEGTIDLNATIADLGIDDCEPALTSMEKQATVADLLTSRSGIYHAAAHQGTPMPKRGIHRPGEQWFYNNWSFNVLGVILERLTGIPIAEDFLRRIAQPLSMQDFQPEHFYFKTIPQSVHPAYKIRMSARDLARIGLLFINSGRWDGVQLIPQNWIDRSVTPYTDLGRGAGFGYSWWTGRYIVRSTSTQHAREDMRFYWASGMGYQYVMVFPDIRTVIAHRVTNSDTGPSSEQMEQLQAMLLASRTIGVPLTTPITA